MCEARVAYTDYNRAWSFTVSLVPEFVRSVMGLRCAGRNLCAAKPEVLQFANGAAAAGHSCRATRKQVRSKKIHRAGGGARTKRAEVARAWACHMDDCTRFELPGSPDAWRMRQTPDDQTHSHLPRGQIGHAARAQH